MSIRQTDNYVWSVTDILGQGATGNVFICRKKRTGKAYAAKVFNNMGLLRPYDVRMREIEVLKKLDHPNVVKLHALEDDHTSRSTILVMELCDTSLFNILELPENFHGLSEKVFKDVIRDCANGMKYLKECNIVHRDVKPGNILRVQTADGSVHCASTRNSGLSVVYKLTDFGAARELSASDQSFMSMYGTEEYLHPDVYEKAVMKNFSGKTFTAAVDMWSLGVTFYHIATGQLPFRPFGGRQNKFTMFEMISNKGVGVISGTQKSKDGPIEYERKLPENTQISQGLKDLVNPILQGLLESHPEKMMNFEEFDERVKDMLSRIVIDVFAVSQSSFQKIYIKREENFAKLQELIAVQTGVSPSSQELYFAHDEFKPDAMAPAESYPEMTVENPLIMIGGEVASAEQLPLRKIAMLPKLQTDQTRLEDDANKAKCYADICYVYLSTAEQIFAACRGIGVAREIVDQVLQKIILALNYLWHYFEAYCGVEDSLLSRCKRELHTMCELFQYCSMEQIEGKSIQSFDEVQKCKAALDSLKVFSKNLSEGATLKDKWNLLTDDLREKPWVNTLRSQVKIIDDIYVQFSKDRRITRRPTNLEDLVHRADKDRIMECFGVIKKQFEEIKDHRASLHTAFAKWITDVRGFRESLEDTKRKLEEQTARFEDTVQRALHQMDDEKGRLVNMIKDRILNLKSGEVQNGPGIDLVTIKNELTPLEQLCSDLIQLAGEGNNRLVRTRELFDRLLSPFG